MIVWQATETLPMPVVPLLPLILFPLLKISGLEETAAPYANPVIFLFMGGFMLWLYSFAHPVRKPMIAVSPCWNGTIHRA